MTDTPTHESSPGDAPELTFEVVTITPEVAEWLLTFNDGNRKPAPNHVKRLARDMKAGKWMLTGVPIIMNGERLLDGQHRLMACVQSGTPFTTALVGGTPTSAMPAIDVGSKPRTVADALQWDGVANAKAVPKVARELMALMTGASLRDSTALNAPTWAEVRDFYHEHSRVIQEGYRLGHRVQQALRKPSAATWGTAFAWLLACDASYDAVELFATKLCTGASLADRSPLLTLRNWAIRAHSERRQLRSDELLIAVVKAWNAWVGGKQMALMRVLPDEKLPTVEEDR